MTARSIGLNHWVTRAGLVIVMGLGGALVAGCGDFEPVSFTRPPTTTVDRGDDLTATTAGDDLSAAGLRPARYTVQPGDSLGSIATRFGLTIDSIMAANGMMDPNRIEVGTVLRIPGPNATTPPPWQLREATTTVPRRTLPPLDAGGNIIEPDPPPPPPTTTED